MAKNTSSFTDDLQTIRGEVAAEVGTILQIAKKQQAASQVQQVKSGDETRGESPVTKPLPEKSAVRPTSPQRKELAASRVSAERTSLCNVTTRLSHPTNELLTAAALRQRLEKQTPATRQDIIEEALCQWLQRHGYDGPS